MILEIDNLTCSISGQQILRNFSISVNIGDSILIQGNNGSGKTTFARLVLGTSECETTYNKFNIFGKKEVNLSLSQRIKSGLFVSFQSSPMFDSVKVGELLTRISEKYSYEDLEILRNLLHLNKLFNEPIGINLSGGEFKRVELSQAVIMKPRLAIFDEIDSGVDKNTRHIFAKEIEKLRADGCAIICITHNNEFGHTLKPNKSYQLINGKLVSM